MEAPPERYEEMIGLALRRCPGFVRFMVAAPLEDPSFADHKRFMMAVDGDTLLGWGMRLRPHAFPDHWRATRVVVASEHQDRGVGRAILEAVTDGLEPTVSLRGAVFDDDPRSLAIARRWGFEVLQHSINSRLELPPAGADRPLPADVTVEASTALEFEDQEAFDAMLVASQTNPEAEFFLMDRAVLLDFMAEGEEPLGVLLRVDAAPAALCWGSASEGNAHIAYTGVDPAFRGRGLGYLVKQEMHRLAYAGGARACLTSNEEHNLGIRHVNATLGYRKVSGSYWVHRPV